EEEMVAVEVEKMLRLAEQCLERKIIDSRPKYNPRPGHRRVLSEGGGEVSLFLPPEVFQRLQTESQDTRKELTPIEEASRLNQKLKANCEARLARLPPAQARTQKTSLTLSLQRQMMENLIIAKARRFAASGTITGEEQEQRVLYTNILEYEQDHEWPKLWKAKLKKNPDDAILVTGLVSCLLSCPDHPVIKLLKRLQYRVYNRLYPLVSKSLPASPALLMKPSRSTQSLLISDSHQNVSKSGTGHSLSSDASLNISYSELDSDGPHTLDRENLFEDMEQFLTQMDRMHALKKHLKAIVKDIHIAIDQLLSLCLLSFECLNTASSKDLCVASIEEAFFTPIWSPLLTLFRKVHRERELSFESSMRLYQDASPGDVGVASKLYPQDPVVLHGSYPYESAVQELRLLCRDCCPQKKLECIVRTLRLICACAEDYCCLHEPDSKTAAIGADDLLPILSYVALHCELPQLVSECAALEEFIHEGYLIGEEGYCLTSMQSALQYVESLHTGGFQLHNTKFI
uniref:VPS9 domain containing 1 n=1 Tax=Hucho hucho TaxID=62062 RepID=A0A4W5JSL7_9TELE